MADGDADATPEKQLVRSMSTLDTDLSTETRRASVKEDVPTGMGIALVPVTERDMKEDTGGTSVNDGEEVELIQHDDGGADEASRDPHHKDKVDLVEQFFEFSSSPVNLKALTDIVTHDVVAFYPTQTLRGKAAFFYHARAAAADAEKHLAYSRLHALRVTVDGLRAVARWENVFKATCCCKPTRHEGYCEFLIEEFAPHDPHEDDDHSRRSPVLATPHYRIKEIRTERIHSPSWSANCLEVLFGCCTGGGPGSTPVG